MTSLDDIRSMTVDALVAAFGRAGVLDMLALDALTDEQAAGVVAKLLPPAR